MVLLVRLGLLAGLCVVLPAAVRGSLPILNGLEPQPQNGSRHETIARRDLGLDDFLEKGRMMNCLMQSTQEDADRAYPGKAHSRNNDFAAIAESGWFYDDDYSPAVANEHYADAYQDLGLEAGDFKGVSLKWRSQERYKPRKGRATILWGEYDNAFATRVGAIIAAHNTSPQAQAEEDDIDRSVYLPHMPAFYNWADMIFLEYRNDAESSGGTVHALEHVFRHNIRNGDTARCMQEAYEVAEVDEPESWGERLVLTPPRAGEEETALHRAFFSMLYTPNLRGICWMLAQRKGEMGVKFIDKIALWDNLGLPQIYVHIAPWNPPAS